MSMFEYIVIAIITSILSALSSGFEAMFIALNVYDLSRINISNKVYNKVEFVILNKRIFVFLFLFFNTIWNVLFSISVFYIFLSLNLSEIVSGVLSVAVITPFLFIFSEVLPKAVFRKYKDRIILFLFPIFLPIAFLGRIFGPSKTEDMSFEHIISTIQKEFEEGEYSAITETIKNIANFEDLVVKNIMKPITEVGVVSVSDSLEKVLMSFDGREFVIVMDGMKPLGVLFVEDVIKMLGKNKLGPIAEIIKEPSRVVCERCEVSRFLEEEFRDRDIVFVVNDSGVLVGVVSYMEIFDVLTRVITDIKKKDRVGNTFVVDGDESISSVLELAGKNYSKIEAEYPWINEFDTVSGIILYVNGGLPKKGQKIKFSDLSFQVLEIDNFKISKVKVLV